MASPVALGGVVFLGAMLYAVVVRTAWVALRDPAEEYDPGIVQRNDVAFVAAGLWPVAIVGWLVWRVLLRPWGWAFHLAGSLGERLGERLRRNG